MKNHLPYALVFIAAILIYGGIFNRLTGRIFVGKTSSQSADLSESDLRQLETKAMRDGDLKSAAKVYWYYRLTRRDRNETEKWGAILNKLDTLPHDDYKAPYLLDDVSNQK